MQRTLLFILCLFALMPLYSQEKKQPRIMLYYSSQCPYSRQVLDYLKEHHRTIPMKNVLSDAKAKKELLELGKKAEVPCLIVDTQAIYRSGAIIDWLESHQELYVSANRAS